LVEAAGIEPASEDRSMRASTCVVRGFDPVLRSSPQTGSSEDPPLNFADSAEVLATSYPPEYDAHTPAPETQPAGTSCYWLSSQCDWFVDTSLVATVLTSS